MSQRTSFAVPQRKTALDLSYTKRMTAVNTKNADRIVKMLNDGSDARKKFPIAHLGANRACRGSGTRPNAHPRVVSAMTASRRSILDRGGIMTERSRLLRAGVKPRGVSAAPIPSNGGKARHRALWSGLWPACRPAWRPSSRPNGPESPIGRAMGQPEQFR